MALEAVLPELPVVSVLMTGKAVLRKAQKRPVQILHLDRGPLRLRNIPGLVALLAGEAGVFTFQDIACLAMVKGTLRRFPVNHAEVFTVVLRMASDAGFVGLFKPYGASMKTAALGNTMVDLLMTLYAPEDR